jgi:hypothetical protein
MNYQSPEKIKLTSEEEILFDQINFDPQQTGLGGTFHDVLHKSCAAAKPLALSLLKRNAVPQVRKDYFTDARYSIGTKMSRMAVFESNGTTGEEIFEHGSFLKYLRYWIFGPVLPKETIEGFCEILNNEIGTSGMELNRRHKYVRDQTRSHALRKHEAAEEFYKLAIEIGLDQDTSRGIRDAVIGLH